MWRELTYSAIISLGLTLVACAGSENKQSASPASSLLEAARAQLDAGVPDSAMKLVDSLTRTFPNEISVQRQAMHLRTQVSAAQIQRALGETDSVLAKAPQIVGELEGHFTTVSNASLVEPYKIDKAVANAFENGTVLQARIDQSGDVYLATALAGRSIGYTTLSVTDGTGSAVTAPAKCESYGGRELVTFHGGKADSLCMFIAQSARPIRVTFQGRGSYSMTLPEASRQAISRTWKYAHAVKDVHEAEGRKIYLTERLKINARQMQETAKQLQSATEK